MRSLVPTLLALHLTACGFGASEPLLDAKAANVAAPTVHEKTIQTATYHIDKRYPSMVGPRGWDKTTLLDSPTPELLWIVGYESRVVDAASGDVISQEYMCHANLDVEPEAYFDAFPTAPSLSGRLFTLSQGQYQIDLPPGFGIPIPSDMELSLATQVLNLDKTEIDIEVKHNVTIRFVRDRDLTTPMTALYQAAVEGFKALEDARYYGLASDETHDPEAFGPGCSVGQAAIAGDVDEDRLGQKFTAHWVVEPGLEVNRTNVTRFLNLPHDTRAHYIAVHLHPYAESLVLKDLTTDTTVFTAEVEASKGRVGIDRVDHYSSAEGLLLHKGHEYELISRYDNTGSINADSMAVMYLYLADKNFQKPTLGG